MQTALYQLVLVDGHVVAQIVKPQLVVRYIGDVAGIGGASFIGIHAV